MITEADKWQKRYEREKSARLQAEALLELKSSELYDSKRKLEKELSDQSSELRQEGKKFTALFHSSADGIILCQPDGTIIDANQAICNLLVAHASSLIGAKMTSLHGISSVHKAQEALDTANRDGYFRYECVFERTNKSSMPAEVSVSRFRVNEKTIIQSIIRDTTVKNKIELEVQQATDEANRANEAKSLFLATMSHEIRTPLNGIIGFTDILLQGEHTEEQEEYLSIIKKSGNILLNIINDILDFSKVEGRDIELERVDFSIKDCIEETLDIHAQKAAQKSIDLLYNIAEQTPIALHGDVGRLRQVLLNFVSNSLKFTQQGSIIISVSHPDPETIAIDVKDTGVGFESHLAEQLFNPFQQADASTTRKYGGTGLGLSICKRLIEIMGGNISASSSPGNGATFSITLPYVPAKASLPSITEVYDLEQLKKYCVLVVDNSTANLSLMKARLSQWGCQVQTISCANAALENILNGEEIYDLIILDMVMSDLNGFHLADKISFNLGASMPPLILTTSSYHQKDRQRALSLGFTTVLHKPIREKELLTTFCRTLHIPFRETLKEPQPAKPEASNDNAKFALIVEDNFINAKLAKMLIERMGVVTHIAHNGKEAIEALKAQEIYSIVFMDMQMPIMDGIEACQRIRKGEAGEGYIDIPIIAMTANTQPEDQKRCKDAGMSEFLTKPIIIAELEKALLRYNVR